MIMLKMLSFIIHHSNFCPNVVHIPKEDFPQDYYDTLVKHSHNDGDRHILYRRIKWNGPIGECERYEWSDIIHQMDIIYEHYAEDEGFDIPDWAERASVENHQYFNSDCIETKCETFVVKEVDVMTDGSMKVRGFTHDTVDDFLKSYFDNLKQKNDFKQ